ncbi:MAG: ATP-binding protein [Pseudomonadota bacterium]|nr:ATP-binding protein [Pseudomonadota bacterium]
MNRATDFMSQGGEMGALTRAHDWSTSPLGAAEDWPWSLKSTLRLVLTSNHPMFIWWGPQLIQFYNDAYRSTMGPERHPGALGQGGRACWGEIWDIIGPQIESVMAGGGATWNVDQLVPVTRHGRREDVWWTYGYSPIQDAEGVRGVLVVCNDVSSKHVARADLAAQLELADRLRGLADSGEVARVAFESLSARLQASRINYIGIDAAAATYTVQHAWRAHGLESVVGATGALADFNPALMADLVTGRAVSIADVAQDERTAANPHYARLDARAVILVPIVKEGRLVAVVTVMRSTPHSWSPSQLGLMENVADRIWSAIERARAEHRLGEQKRAESERLKAMFGQAPGFVCILGGPQHVYEFANTAYCRLVGDRPLIGKPVREALPDLVGQGFFELLDEVYGSATAFTAHDVPLVIERTPGDGPAASYIDFVYQPILGADGRATGIFVEGFDTTERHVAKAALEASQERMQEGMKAARMVVWDIDLQAQTVQFSDNATAVFGGSWSGLSEVWSNVAPDDLARLKRKRDAAIAALGSYEELIRMARPDNGDTIWLQVHGNVIADGGGRAVSIRGVSIDVTERIRAEEALRQADRRKDEFLAMLAHELRNPLAPISAAAHLLRVASHDERLVRKSSDVIARQVEHMTSLVSDMLDVSRVNTGLVTLEQEPIDIGRIVDESVEQVRPFIDARRHRLVIDAAGAPAIVAGDRKRLVQVLTNLLQNAAKFTPEGGTVALRVEARAASVLVSVSDSGIGIDTELLPHVFELFTQGKRSSDRSQGGLGLGLALVKSLVVLHGGDVGVASEGAGKGATFTISLPLAAPAGDDATVRAADPEHARARGRLRLLVVDDNVDAAQMLSMFLREAGHEVAVEHGAAAVLERVERETADAHLLDIGLPDMDGNELARRLRARPETARATLIAVTGYGQENDRSSSMAAGFDHYFVKPADTSRLLALLSDIRPMARAA